MTAPFTKEEEMRFDDRWEYCEVWRDEDDNSDLEDDCS